MSKFFSAAPSSAVRFPAPGMAEDPWAVQQFLQATSDTMVARDIGMNNLLGILAAYTDNEVIGVNGKRLICLSKLAGDASGDTLLPGAFWTQYVDSGHTYLQGGSVIGGFGGSATLADYKVIDGVGGPVQASGQLLYLQINCTANVSSGVMLPGVTVNSAAYATGASLPANHSFTISALTGNIYVEIGRWTTTEFLPSGQGNFNVLGCLGNVTTSRT